MKQGIVVASYEATIETSKVKLGYDVVIRIPFLRQESAEKTLKEMGLGLEVKALASPVRG